MMSTTLKVDTVSVEGCEGGRVSPFHLWLGLTDNVAFGGEKHRWSGVWFGLPTGDPAKELPLEGDLPLLRIEVDRCSSDTLAGPVARAFATTSSLVSRRSGEGNLSVGGGGLSDGGGPTANAESALGFQLWRGGEGNIDRWTFAISLTLLFTPSFLSTGQGKRTSIQEFTNQ